MSRVKTDGGPPPIAKYSQAVVTNAHDRLVFTAGCIGMVRPAPSLENPYGSPHSQHPESGELVPGGIEAEATRTMENLKAIVEAAGGDMSCLVKTSVMLAGDMRHYAAFNKVYSTYFSGPPPARTCVAVAALPKNALVEVEGVLALPEQGFTTKLVLASVAVALLLAARAQRM